MANASARNATNRFSTYQVSFSKKKAAKFGRQAAGRSQATDLTILYSPESTESCNAKTVPCVSVGLARGEKIARQRQFLPMAGGRPPLSPVAETIA